MPPPPPDEHRLLSLLRLKIAGEPLPDTVVPHFHDADIYTADPALLTALFDPAPAKEGETSCSSWFFFTHVRPKSSSDSRKSRQVTGGVGTWHSERAPRRVLDDEGDCAGHSQYFSYKLRTGKNRSERTEWYMVEFSDGGQEADHERIHGGESQLVLCKIYKAHTHSRSGNGSTSRSSCSASARKRKAVDEASAPPVKAKRWLFDSTTPASVARSQEQLRQSNLMCHPSSPTTSSKRKIGDTSYYIALMSKADDEATTSQLKIGETSDFSRFWPETETSFDWGYMTTGGALPMLKNCSWTDVRDVNDVFCGRDACPSAFHTSDDTTVLVCSMPSAPVLPTLENSSRTNVRDVGDVFCGQDAWPSAFRTSNDNTAFVCVMPSAPVLPTLENCSGSNVGDVGDLFCRQDARPSSFHTSNDTTAFVWAPVLPTLENCSRADVRNVGDVFGGQDAWPSAFHTSNDTTAFVCGMPSTPVLPTLENCSRTNVRDVDDVFCGRDAWPSAFRTSNDTTAFVCGMPSAPILPLPGRPLCGAAATTFAAADHVTRGSFTVH